MTEARELAKIMLLAWLACGMSHGQTTPGVRQGGTGATSPEGARANLGAAAAAHTHALTELQGITGRSGTSGTLLTFGGGAVSDGECARFDSSGNVVGSAGPCGGTTRSNYSATFSNATSVTLQHALGTANVLVHCYDGAERGVEPDRVTVIDANSVTVSFWSPQSGRCVVNGTTGAGGAGAIVVANSGSGAAVLKTGTSVTGRTLKAGTNVTITEGTDEITIHATGSGGGITTLNAQTGLSQTLAAGPFVSVSSASNVHTIGVTNLQGSGSKLVTTAPAPADGCASWSGGTLASTGTACGSGGGSYTAGTGISLTGGTISIDPATVPTFLTGSATISDWDGGGDAIPAQSCREKSFLLAGAATGDAVIAGWPAVLPSQLAGMMYAGGASSIVVRLCNPTSSAIPVLDGLGYRATVIRVF